MSTPRHDAIRAARVDGSPPGREREGGTSPPRRRRHLFRGTFLITAAIAVLWALNGTGVGISSLINGREGAARLVSGLLPPDLSGDLIFRVLVAVVETLQISIAALFFGAVVGLPLAALIAGNMEAPGWMASVARVTAALLRGVPELLWALLFVATVGLGPAAGVYAVSLHAAGQLAKLSSEQLEAVDPAPVESMRLTGGSRPVTMLLGVVPQARNGIVSVLLYQWECNIRSSAVIGFVGAGGIGQALAIALRLFRYEELATLLIAVLVLVLSVDRFSRSLRRRMGAAAR